MSYYPVFLDLEDKKVLVVGGGAVAQRKVKSLLEYGASVHIVGRGMTETLKMLVEDRQIVYLGDAFKDKFLDGTSLVFVATDDHQFNRRIAEKSREKGALVNAVDQPADCDFIVPSIVRRGDLSIAISTSGKSPAFAKHLRKELERHFGKEYEAFLRMMGSLRSQVLSLGLSQQENSRIFHEIVDSHILEALAQGDLETIKATLSRILPAEMPIGEILNSFEDR